MHSVANLATLQTPLATFFPSKKRPNLIKFLRLSGRAARYWKKLTLRYFVFLQYILRYEKKKKKHDFNISVWKKKSMIGVIL